MTKNRYSSLWRWICARILALAIGSVIVIATCMWLRYAVQNYWNLGRMPVSVRQEFLALSQNPQANPARFHQIVDTWWGLSYSTPSIASADWVTVALLVLVMIPFIVVMGLRYARPLALQFSRLRDAAKDVAEGQFGRQAELIRNAPAEMVSFASDFNTMTVKLARYEKELRTSHVAMAHELRSPLTAAIGRLQGMLDGVFDASPEQLAMVMKHYLEFRDDGPGVSSQFLPEMFNRFSREEQSRARHSGGSGLGLSIASAICQAHGGSISASLPETGGLAVTILLPSTSSKMENSRS
ncbi:ATP-binding protein [Klebsiella quasipneumoniae]|uniref:ATP-binding protein n=1 Tax=Klebsiella quasipneumoniae TaxID=1463165 RepID=UPI000DE66E84|nr:ATP-binding protein [Klebsiella quasipneumoniae]SSL24292.1 sensor histidine kinase [Klebsiella quasipneumoniae]